MQMKLLKNFKKADLPVFKKSLFLKDSVSSAHLESLIR